MNLKIIAGLLIVMAVGIGLAYWFGHSKGIDAGAVTCAKAQGADAANYQAAQTKAEQLARQAQSAADQQQIAQLQKMAKDAQDAAATAQATAATAMAQSATLTSDLTRLKNEDKTVSKWSGHCLPTSLLASVHPGVSSKAYPSQCRAAGGSNTGAVSAPAAKPAAVH